MSLAVSPPGEIGRRGFATASPASARIFLLVVAISAAATGLLADRPEAVARAVTQAGGELTRLLRFMALLKSMMAVAAFAAVIWRLGAPVTATRALAHAAAVIAMAIGPGLIWGMIHLKLGAALLHGGLFATIILLWRDPAVAQRLDAMIRHRRAQSRDDRPPDRY